MDDIRYTGVRNYERITSSSQGKRCSGTVMILRREGGLAYPPSREFVDKLTSTQLRDTLSVYEFFGPMSTEERYTYLMSNAVGDKDLYMSSMSNLYVKFDAIHFYTAKSSARESELSDDVINVLMRGNENDPEGFWPISYVFNQFSRRATSTTKRHTLVFRPSNWKLMEQSTTTTNSYTGFYCCLPSGECGYGGVSGKIYPFQKIAVIVDSTKYIEPNLLSIACALVPCDNYNSILTRLSKYSPGFLKSLLQKIIRYRPLTVENIDARVWLLSTFIALYMHAGAFVPQYQKFVTGREGAVKRLAVSIIEDSQTSDTEALYSMLAFALLTSNKIRYDPDEALLAKWMKAALESLQTANYYNYNTEADYVIPCCAWLNALLSSIKSFETDIRMVSSITGYTKQQLDRDRDMPLCHAVDQHCYPSLAWYIDSNINYDELFCIIWQNVSSINPRKPKEINMLIYNEVRRAQQLLIKAREHKLINRNIIPGNYSFSYTLDDDYLAATVGIVEYNDTLAVIMPSNVHEFRAARKPIRGKEPTLHEEEYVAAVENLKWHLYNGIPVANEFIEIIYYRDNVYYVMSKGNIVAWEEFKTLRFTFPLHSVMEKTLENAITYTGNGVEENAIVMTDGNVIKRLMLYTGKSHIKPHSVNREGFGTDYGVSPLDSKVYKLLGDIAIAYPACLEHHYNDGFMVKHRQLFDHVVSKLVVNNTYKLGNWRPVSPETRRLYDHQLSAIRQIKNRNIIWMAPGMGKTAVITSHIAHLVSMNIMPLYCVYTIPKSAWENLKYELELREIPYVINRLEPNCVSVINHDTLRKMVDTLREVADSTLLIVDEFHNTLNKGTQRTTAALELATLSWSFIAMTGTLYKDDKVDNLFPWLQLLYKFEVTAKNYWVAIAGIISIKCDTAVKTERIIIEEPLNTDELTRYKLVVPQMLGGTSLTIDFRKAVDICYEAITRRIVNEILGYINNNKGLAEPTGVFVVAKNAEHAMEIKNRLNIDSVEIISSRNPSSYNPSSPTAPWVVITTPTHREGYDMTKYKVMISGVYFSNEATRQQLERRINRVNQISDVVRIVIIHAGILSYVHEKYDGVRNMASALESFRKESGVEVII